MPRLLRSLTVSTVLALAGGLGLVSIPSAQAADTTGFITSISSYAQQTHRDFGVPASVTIAQAILESGWGGSGLSTDYKNYFGIKCNGNISPYMLGCVSKSTIEYYGTTQYTITASFRTYSSVLNSFLDHANILKVNSRYANAFNYSDDPDQFAVEIALAGYATDPNYASNLTLIMQRYNLYAYDALYAKPTASPSATTSATATATATATASASATATATASASASASATASQTQASIVNTAITFPTLSYNASGYKVRVAQFFLQARGYYVPATGWYGPMTQGAIRRFQTAAGLPATGTLDSATFAKLTLNTTYGQIGSQVRGLQTALNAKGYSVLVTGYYGPMTLGQVNALASSNGLAAPSRVTNQIWSLLLS